MPDKFRVDETGKGALAMPDDLLFRDLGFSGQFVVWSVRKWVEVMRAEAKETALLRHTFMRAGICNAFDAFDYMMRIITVSARRTIEVRCVCCPAVSPDETLFLGLVEAGQQGDAVNAHLYLDSFVAPAAARIAHSPVVQLAEAMHRAGMPLSGNVDRHLRLRFDGPVH